MSFFGGLDAEKYDRVYSDRELVRRIAGHFATQGWRIAVVSALVILNSIVSAGLPILVSRGIDMLKEGMTIGSAAIIALAVLLVGVANWGINWARRLLTVQAIANVVMELATGAFDAAAKHDLSFHDQFSTGRVVSRITSDTRDFGELVTLTADVVAQFAEAFILTIIMFTYEWRLTLVLYATLPLVFALAFSFRKMARTVTRDGMRSIANVNATIKESVSGIAIAKNFRQEDEIFNEFDDANCTSYRVNLKRGLVLSLVFPSLNTFGGFITGLIIYVGGLSAAQGIVTAGAWYLFLLSIDRFLWPIMNLSSFWAQIQNGLSAAERVFGLVDAEHAVIQECQEQVATLAGRIQFRSIYFRYNQPEDESSNSDAASADYSVGGWILEDFDLDIKPGETIALVGHTGAGKSSIAKLVARFYEYQSGALLIDGQDIRTMDLNAYRSQLGIVSQTPFLFSGSVIDNIRYASHDASQTEILDLAHRIGEGEWLETLPAGLNTEVGERGALLSMGQRQLVALMRVLVHNPRIFILDEATASIDPFTEWQIQQALNLILARTTSILIAHRLSTVRSANRILTIEDGHIIEEGDHDSLLSRGGHYADLYNTYFRHQSLDYIENSRQFAG